jgi:flagellar assembly protein FliH
MSTVIKHGASGHAVQRVAFNLEDMSRQANNYLDKVRVQAAQIVVEAQKQADAVRRKAEEDGKQAAFRAAEKVLDQKVGAKLESLLPALEQVVGQLADAKQAWLKHWERATVKLACAIAEKITRRQVQECPDIAVELVREGLEMAAGWPQVQVQLNPIDVESLGGQIKRLVGELQSVAAAQIKGDPAIELGSCRVETQHGAIDQQFSVQLARIEAELTAGNDD